MSARVAFAQAMVAWLNTRFAHKGMLITEDTPLFKGLIDSLGILALIAWTEEKTGETIPDKDIRMDNFGTVARIARTFVREEIHAHR